MRSTFAATFALLDGSANIVTLPNLKKLGQASSLHVVCFSSKGEILLVESEGAFTISDLDRLLKVAREACLGTKEESQMDVDGKDGNDGEATSVLDGLREVVQGKIISDNRWRSG